MWCSHQIFFPGRRRGANRRRQRRPRLSPGGVSLRRHILTRTLSLRPPPPRFLLFGRYAVITPRTKSVYRHRGRTDQRFCTKNLRASLKLQLLALYALRPSLQDNQRFPLSLQQTFLLTNVAQRRNYTNYNHHTLPSRNHYARNSQESSEQS